MCVCACIMCIYIYIYTHVYVLVYTQTHTHTHTHTYIYIYIAQLLFFYRIVVQATVFSQTPEPLQLLNHSPTALGFEASSAESPATEPQNSRISCPEVVAASES